jgi:rhodanese-related sulfurtransferase
MVDSVLAALSLESTQDLGLELFSQALVSSCSAASEEDPLVLLDLAVLRAMGPYTLLNRCTDPADQRRLVYLVLLQGHLQLNVLSSSTSSLPSDQFQNLLARIAPQVSFTPSSLSSLRASDIDAEILRHWDALHEAMLMGKEESEPLGVQIVLAAIEQLHGLPANQNYQDLQHSSPFDEVEPPELSDLVREIHDNTDNVPLVAVSFVLDALVAQRVAGGAETSLLLIDVRTKEEYDVSCIPGAIHLEVKQDASGWKLVSGKSALAQLADAYTLATMALEVSQRSSSNLMNASIKRRQANNTRAPTVVAYCDIGRRSALVVKEITAALTEAIGLDNGSFTVHSLCGGIINFYNSGGRVVKGGDPSGGAVVNAVHPGSEQNRKFITRPSTFH